MVCCQISWNAVLDSWKPSCGCWERNEGPLEEQLMLLTVELSLQSLLTLARTPPSAAPGVLLGPEQRRFRVCTSTHGFHTGMSVGLFLYHVMCSALPRVLGLCASMTTPYFLILRDMVSGRGMMITVSSSSLAGLYIEFPENQRYMRQNKTWELGVLLEFKG